MDVISALREQWSSTHWLLEACMEDISPDQFAWNPPGNTSSVGYNYLHCVLAVDESTHGMFGGGKPPLYATAWAEKTGLSTPPPAGAVMGGDINAFATWCSGVAVDLAAVRSYAAAVYADTDAYFATLQPSDLDGTMDFTAVGFGTPTLNWVLFNFLIAHVTSHTGEIAAIKGLQGLKGYPF